MARHFALHRIKYRYLVKYDYPLDLLDKRDGWRQIMRHLGPARNETELVVLMEQGPRLFAPGQKVFGRRLGARPNLRQCR